MTGSDVVSGIDVSGDRFVVRASFFGQSYAIKTESGENLLWADRRIYPDGVRIERDDAPPVYVGPDRW